VEGRIGKTNVDELTSVLLGYDTDAVSQFTCTALVQMPNEFNIYGTEGSICIHEQFWNAIRATLYRDNENSTVTKPYRVNGFEYQIEEAMTCIREGRLESTNMTHEQTLANLEVMDTIRRQIGLRYPFE
jgi:predicted dehydrogenase